MTGYFIQAFIYLVAAVIAVPIAKRLGLGSVLGYLIAGVVIGPVTGLVGDETVTIQHFAEFGVVMMLFLVGLELEPKTLWQMRNRLFGLGGLQVCLTASAIMLIALILGLSWSLALAVGLILSLSSTAIVLQTFNEKGLHKTEGGRNAFSILLFQDIAVIPMLAFIPLLAIPELIELANMSVESHGHANAHGDSSHGDSHGDDHSSINLAAHLPGWAYALVVIGSIAGLILGGHFLSHPLFRFVASTGLREIFVACTLLLVIGIAALMGLIGLSPALGTFLAGVVLANSEFRHELESNIEPFKGLLLGLFFITVGAGVDFGVLTDQFGVIIALTLGVIVLKAAIIYALATFFKIGGSDRWLVTLSLAQAGEFGFVLLSFSLQQYVVDSETAQLLQLVVALSMFLTPLLFIALEKVIMPRFEDQSNQREADLIEESGRVIIAGAGRFGQIVNRLLVANDIHTVVLDHQASQVDNMRAISIKTYFGDATRLDLLHTAGIEEADLFVVAIDNPDEALELVKQVKHEHPNLKVLARAFDRGSFYQLKLAGADFIQSETYHSALELASEALVGLGFHPFEAEKKKQAFKRLEMQASESLYEQWQRSSEGERYNNDFRLMFMELDEKISEEMDRDRADGHIKGERSWTPPPKGYTDNLE